MSYRLLKLYAHPTPANSTNNPGERVAVLPLTKGLPYNRQTVLSLTIPAGTLQPGDLLHVEAEWQVSGKLPYTVMVAGYLLLADAPTRTDVLVPGAAYYLTQPNGTNLTTPIHHLAGNRQGWFEVPADLDASKTWHANVVLYSASTAMTAGAALTVNAGYGRLCVAHYRKEVVVP